MHKLFLFLICLLTFIEPKAQGIREYSIPSNGVNLYVKTMGSGDPLIMLHGAMVDMNDWEYQIPELSKSYQLILIDTRGHGKSSFDNNPLSYDKMSDDVYNVMKYLKIDSAHILGFSDGGNTALYLAIKHPEKIRKMIIIGSNLQPTPDAVFPYFLDKVRDWDLTSMEQALRQRFKQHPNPELFPDFIRAMQILLLSHPDLTTNDLNGIKAPTLVMVSDYDLVTLPHTLTIFEALPNAYLCVVPGCKHYNIKEKPVIVNAAISDFLKYPFATVDRFSY